MTPICSLQLIDGLTCGFSCEHTNDELLIQLVYHHHVIKHVLGETVRVNSTVNTNLIPVS